MREGSGAASCGVEFNFDNQLTQEQRRTLDMQTSNKREAKTQSTGATARPLHLFGAALLAAAALPACSVPTADAGVETSKDTTKHPQSVLTITPSAPCHTAPARNNPRKFAGVAGLRQGFNHLYYSRVVQSTGADFGPRMFFSQNDGGFSSTDRWTGGDFDGDGDQDLIAVWDNGGSTALALRQSGGNSFVTSQLPIAQRNWSLDTVWIPGDFDNNGRTDLAAIFHDGSSTSIDVYRSTPSGFATPQRWMTQGLPWSATTKWSVGDFDGGIDKRDDLVSVRDNSGASAAVWISNGSTFTGSTWSTVGGWDQYTRYVAGDFTGDGKADLAGVWNNGGGTAIAVYPSAGNAFSYPSQWIFTNLGFFRTGHVVAGYFNNDDKADIVIDWDYDAISNEVVYLSSGTSFTYGFRGVTSDYWSQYDSICSGVFNAQ